jgi:hypothetical protein
MDPKKITLNVGDQELHFEVSLPIYNTYIDQIKVDSKVVPSLNFVRQALADKAQRPVLDELCNQGLAIDIAGALVEEFRPKVEITIKK